MTKNTQANLIYVAVVLLIAICLLWWSWYRSSLQATLWQREGIQITTWEVMTGAKPAQRLIEVK